MMQTMKHLGKKLNEGKQPFLWSYQFTVLFWPVLLGCIHSPTSTVLVSK